MLSYQRVKAKQLTTSNAFLSKEFLTLWGATAVTKEAGRIEQYGQLLVLDD